MSQNSQLPSREMWDEVYEIKIPQVGSFFVCALPYLLQCFASISELWLSAIHFGGFCAICALMANEADDLDHSSIKFWANVSLALIAVATSSYLILFENALYARETEFIFSDYMFALLAVGLAIEFTRRTTGWFMPVLILNSPVSHTHLTLPTICSV